MPETDNAPFKEFINSKSIRGLADELSAVDASFPAKAFQKAAGKKLEQLELKDRVRQVAAALHQHLPNDYPNAVGQICAAVGPALPDTEEVSSGFAYWPYLHFVEEYGGEHFDASMNAIHHLTQRFSAEFAIRPFLAAEPKRTLERIRTWLDDPSVHVRRLCSEGTRPLLPWGLRLKEFQAEPMQTAFILDHLLDDPELFVRRSVANHLNDHAKTHPDYVVKVAKRWKRKKSAERQWVVRHALRTLVKRGHKPALALLGYETAAVRVDKFSVSPKKLRVGQTVTIDLELSSSDGKAHPVLIDYSVYYKGANGQLRPKVFKWKEAELPAEGRLSLSKKQHFKPVTTRTLYPGEQAIEIQINGEAVARQAFELRE